MGTGSKYKKRIMNSFRSIRDFVQLPLNAKIQHLKDLTGLPTRDPGIERAINESVAWLCLAQDNSVSQDGGVAHHFSLISGWSPSYPETTGYIVPTLLNYARLRKDETCRERAKRMLDWLVSIQLPAGGFQGGLIDSNPVVPVTFNTGQILIGLAHGVQEFGDEYREAMCRAGDWLVEIQDPDGCWRKFPSPFVRPGEKSYDTHVAWGLFEAARIEPERGYAEAALANVRWALGLQRKNGWFEKCCLSDPSKPLTHAVGYVLRGIIEAYRFSNCSEFLEASVKTSNGLLTAIRQSGFLPGCLNSEWQGTVPWACLTGSVQIAHCLFMMFEFTGDLRYREAACAVNRYVRCTMHTEGPRETGGAIRGSFPIYGGYNPYQYPNWATKFFADANLLEEIVRNQPNKKVIALNSRQS